MSSQFWRAGLAAVLLVGLIAVINLSATLGQVPNAAAAEQAERLKTTEEALDPACNALGKLQVNISAVSREQTTDESGGAINTCRYEIELVNTDETYSIRVFTNASGASERGEQVWHTRHGHKALDPGEAYRREMYVTVYPDGGEESFFYTYLKATYNDLDFPKDCQPMVDHLYTWDLPYRLVEAPCMDLSSDPPELVEWTPPEGYVEENGGEAGLGEAGGSEAGGSEAGGSEAGGLQSGEENTGDSQPPEEPSAQQGGDLMNQLIELLVLGDLGSLDQWEG